MSGRRRGIDPLPVLGGAGALAALLAALLIWTAPVLRRSVDPAMLTPFGARGWTIDLNRIADGRGLLWAVGRMDSMSAPAIARHRVLVDGRPLGMPHAQHAEIAELGQGRHSFWNGALLLSMPEGVGAAGDVGDLPADLEVELHLRPCGWIVGAGVLGGTALVWCLRRVRGRTLGRVTAGLGMGLALAMLPIAWFDPPRSAWADAVPPLLLALAVVGATCCWLEVGLSRLADRPPRAGRTTAVVRRVRRVLTVAAQRWTGPLGRTAAVALLLLSLLRFWAPLPPPAHHAADVGPAAFCRGRVMTADALAYWSGAETLRWAGSLNEFSSRRPVYPTLLAIESRLLGGDRQMALLLNAALAGIALGALGAAAGRILGPWAGLGTLAFAIGYAQQFVAYTLTEQIGLTLGAIALTQILRGFEFGSQSLLALGSLNLGMAMMVRSGALLALPAPALAAMLLIRPRNRCIRAVLACLLPLVCAWGISNLVFRIAAPAGAAPNANAPYVTLGMAMGGDWTDAHRWLLESSEGARDMTDRERAALLRQETIRRVREHPEVLLASLARGLTTFADNWTTIAWDRFASRGAVGALLDHLGLERLAPEARGAPPWLFGTIAALASVLALVSLVRTRPAAGVPLALLLLGTLASLPFIWIDGRWRGLAPTWPVLSVAAAVWLMPPRMWSLRAARGAAERPQTWVSTAHHARHRLLASLGLILCLAPLPGAVVFSRREAPAPPGGAEGGPSIMVPSPQPSSSVIVEAPGAPGRFGWLGPARLGRDEYIESVRAWGRDVDQCLRLLDRHGQRLLIAQVVRVDSGALLPRELLIAADPTVNESPRTLETWTVELLDASAYLGGTARRLEPD